MQQIYHWVGQWKNFENRLTVEKVMGKSLGSCLSFLTHGVDWQICRLSPILVWVTVTCTTQICARIYIPRWIICSLISSVLWRCWLGGMKGIRPVKNWVVGCWRGCLSGARCRLAYGPADATATHSLASVKSRLVLPFWYRLTRVVPDKRPLNACARARVCMNDLFCDRFVDFPAAAVVCCSQLRWLVCDVVSNVEHSADHNTVALHVAPPRGRHEDVHTVTGQHRSTGT